MSKPATIEIIGEEPLQTGETLYTVSVPLPVFAKSQEEAIRAATDHLIRMEQALQVAERYAIELQRAQEEESRLMRMPSIPTSAYIGQA